MGLILSIQGGMAVGKTTAIQWLASMNRWLIVFLRTYKRRFKR